MGYAVAQTSLAHTYGNVTSLITEYVKGLFPADYFNTVHVSTTIAYRQLAYDKNMNREFRKKRKPMLIVRPRIELFDSDSFLHETLLTTRMTDNFHETSFTNLQEFLLDNNKGMELKFLLNRLVMNFEITIIHETFMRHVDIANFLKNRLVLNRPCMLSTALESYIPRELLEMISKDMKVPMYEDKSPKKFLDYMNSVSMYPISYKMKNSTGNDEFFRFYPANVMVEVKDLSMDEGSKRGMVADNHQITFNIRTEFDGAGLYYYFTKNIENLHVIIGDIIVKTGEDLKDIIPLFTVENVYSSTVAEGWSIYASSIYQVERHKGKDDLDVSSLFATSNLQSVFKYSLEKGIPIKTFFIPMVMKNNKLLQENEGFKMDYTNLVLETLDLDMEATYRLVFHINPVVVNDIISDINNFGEEY